MTVASQVIEAGTGRKPPEVFFAFEDDASRTIGAGDEALAGFQSSGAKLRSGDRDLVLGTDGRGAPTSLHFDDGATVPLDVVVSTDDHAADFRTNATVLDAAAGRVAELQQWWVPDAYDAVVDVERNWVRERPTHDHEHCSLDWAKIGYGGAEFGWRCDRDWVCGPCYDEYFVRDRLDLRRGSQ